MTTDDDDDNGSSDNHAILSANFNLSTNNQLLENEITLFHKWKKECWKKMPCGRLVASLLVGHDSFIIRCLYYYAQSAVCQSIWLNFNSDCIYMVWLRQSVWIYFGYVVFMCVDFFFSNSLFSHYIFTKSIDTLGRLRHNHAFICFCFAVCSTAICDNSFSILASTEYSRIDPIWRSTQVVNSISSSFTITTTDNATFKCSPINFRPDCFSSFICCCCFCSFFLFYFNLIWDCFIATVCAIAQILQKKQFHSCTCMMYHGAIRCTHATMQFSDMHLYYNTHTVQIFCTKIIAEDVN